MPLDHGLGEAYLNHTKDDARTLSAKIFWPTPGHGTGHPPSSDEVHLSQAAADDEGEVAAWRQRREVADVRPKVLEMSTVFSRQLRAVEEVRLKVTLPYRLVVAEVTGVHAQVEQDCDCRYTL